MKITICSLWTSEIETLGRLTEANHWAYAQKHGYNYVSGRFVPAGRPASWGKISLLLSQFKDNDWLLWIDADAVFTNFSTKIEWFVQEGKNFIASADYQGLNCGVFLVSTMNWTYEWLERVYNMDVFIHHPWWEQAAIISTYWNDAEVRRRVSIVKKLQSFPQDWVNGDFIFHTPGMNQEDKIVLLREKIKCGGS